MIREGKGKERVDKKEWREEGKKERVKNRPASLGWT